MRCATLTLSVVSAALVAASCSTGPTEEPVPEVEQTLAELFRAASDTAKITSHVELRLGELGTTTAGEYVPRSFGRSQRYAAYVFHADSGQEISATVAPVVWITDPQLLLFRIGEGLVASATDNVGGEAEKLEVTATGGIYALVVYERRLRRGDFELTLEASTPSDALDVLFVVDNSGSMADLQVALAGAFSDFLDGLAQGGELPDLHIGVVSSDLGAGNTAIAACDLAGDGGALQSTPRIDGCNAPTDAYLVDRPGESGRETNYEGELADAFACIGQLGVDGCGFEQPLEAAVLALGGLPANAGFLRDDAALAVVFVSDEDDCSASNFRLFDPGLDSEEVLGPLSSFRCFEHGVVCEPDDPRSPGLKVGCQSREESIYVHPLSRYRDAFLSIKPADRLLYATVSATPSTDNVIVEVDETGNPALASACTTVDATPSVRLTGLAGELATAGVETFAADLCTAEETTHLFELGQKARTLLR